jgi:fumarate reductase subunit D
MRPFQTVAGGDTRGTMADNPVESASASGDVIREQDKIMLVLAYLGLLALIPFLTVKDSDYVRFHAKQGLAICIAWVALAVIAVIPILGQIIACFGFLALLVVSIIGIVKAFKPERWKIPLISSIAEKF